MSVKENYFEQQPSSRGLHQEYVLQRRHIELQGKTLLRSKPVKHQFN